MLRLVRRVFASELDLSDEPADSDTAPAATLKGLFKDEETRNVKHKIFNFHPEAYVDRRFV